MTIIPLCYLWLNAIYDETIIENDLVYTWIVFVGERLLLTLLVYSTLLEMLFNS